jgi:2-deoxy-D-gluconate 3-dehydrogenase
VSPAPFDLTGRVALVTGATRGIGMAMAGALASSGADIIAVGSTIGPQSPVVELVRSHGRSCATYQCDLTNRDDTRRLAAWASDRGAPDILVNNAGAISRSPAVEHGDAQWDQIIELDLTSPFFLTREIGKQMIGRGSGKILFTASLLSFQGGVNVASYTAAKSGIAGLTRALANEWAPLGINVNAIAPGYIATENTRPLREDPHRSEAILGRIPAGRWGDPQDIAGAAVFLCSSASDYVNGVVLPVDGGWLGR